MDGIHPVKQPINKLYKQMDVEKEDCGYAFIIECARRLHGKYETHDFMKAPRPIGEVFGQVEQYTGDEWVEYHLPSLIGQGSLEYRGELHAIRYYEVRSKEALL